jgi:hypothetical protein
MQSESASFAELAFHGNPASVGFHDVFHNSKTEPGPPQLSAPGLVHAVEALKEAILMLFRDAAALIANSDQDLLFFRIHFHPHTLSRFAVFDGVVQ